MNIRQGDPSKVSFSCDNSIAQFPFKKARRFFQEEW